MKHIKSFESSIIYQGFKPGDIVTKLVDNIGNARFNNKTGRIIKYHSGSRNDYDVKFNEFYGTYWFRYDEIRFATPEEIEKFEMIEKANKYNL